MGTPAKRKWWQLSRGAWIFLAVEVIAVAAFFYRTLSPAPDLDRAPEESRRAVHPSGYSIIIPRNYRATVSDDEWDNAILAHPERGRSRYTSTYYVTRLKERSTTAPSGNVFAAGSFQDQPAMIASGPTGKYWIWRAEFERSSVMYQIGLMIPDNTLPKMSTPPERWRPYLESFRVEASTTTSSASKPE